MPRGKYVNHKGRNRNFTSVEQLEEERKNEEKKKWRKTQEASSSDEDEEGQEGSERGSGSESSESEAEEAKGGASSVIEIQNPNRVQKKAFQKVDDVDEDEKPQLSRKEREQIEKQKVHAAYMKRHAEGKTAQAKADLARLAIIKQHRAEAAARREAEKKEKDSKK